MCYWILFEAPFDTTTSLSVLWATLVEGISICNPIKKTAQQQYIRTKARKLRMENLCSVDFQDGNNDGRGQRALGFEFSFTAEAASTEGGSHS